jgi:glutamine synthetase
MSKSKLEYIWLDGHKPTQNMRSKTKVENDFSGKLEDCPIWSFDGSSTEQASGGSSDCLLKPVAIFPDPVRKNGFLVMSEVLSADALLTQELKLMMMMMTSGLVLNKNIS